MGWDIVKISIKSFSLTCHWRTIFSLIIYLGGQFIDVNRVLKFPTIIIALLSVFSFVYVNFALYTVRYCYIGCIYSYIYYIFLLDWSFHHYVIPFFAFVTTFVLMSALSNTHICDSLFFFISICTEYIFQPFLSVCVSLDLH